MACPNCSCGCNYTATSQYYGYLQQAQQTNNTTMSPWQYQNAYQPYYPGFGEPIKVGPAKKTLREKIKELKDA